MGLLSLALPITFLKTQDDLCRPSAAHNMLGSPTSINIQENASTFTHTCQPDGGNSSIQAPSSQVCLVDNHV